MPESPGTRLRQAWERSPIMLPGAFNALVARMAEQLGFPAIYLSGGALSVGLAGVPDVGLLTATEFAEQARYMAGAVSIPLLVDADTGFGDPLNVERTVRLYESAGAAGLHIEDQEMPKRCGHLSGKSLIPAEAMAAKVRAAVRSRTDPSFVIVARVDARGVTDFEDAVARATVYREAGADMIFPEALASADEFVEFARRVPGPLLANMTEFGKSPLLPFDHLARMGYRAVLYPLTVFRVAMRASHEALQTLRSERSQEFLLGSMQTRQELYDIVGYKDYEARDRVDFQGTRAPRPAPDE